MDEQLAVAAAPAHLHDMWRLPKSHGREALLAAANARLQKFGEVTARQRLGGGVVDALTALGEPVVVRSAARLDGMDLETFGELLQSHAPFPHLAAVSRTGMGPLADEDYTAIGDRTLGTALPIAGRVAQRLAHGDTIVMHGVDRQVAALNQLCESIEGLLPGAQVSTNSYLSAPAATGFGPHWDEHDSIIVQARGAKRWALSAPVVAAAQAPFVQRHDVGPVDRVVDLGPGDILLVPRGWGHDVETCRGDVSLHWTISVERPTRSDLLRRLALHHGHNSNWRLDLHDVDADRLPPLALPHELAEATVAAARLAIASRSRLNLATLLDGRASTCRLRTPGGFVIGCADSAAVGTTRVGVGRQAFDMGAAAIGIVAGLAAPLDAPHANDSDPARAVVRHLLEAGLADPYGDGDLPTFLPC